MRHKKTGGINLRFFMGLAKNLIFAFVHFFCFDVQRTTNQLYKCHGGIVAGTEATLQDTKVTTRTLVVTGTKLIERIALIPYLKLIGD